MPSIHISPVLRTYFGLVLLLVGVIQARVTWRGLWGLSLARHHRRLGYLVAGCLIVLGVTLLWRGGASQIPRSFGGSWSAWVWIAALAVPGAVFLIVLFSSLLNADRHPPDARHPGPGEPYACEAVHFQDGTVRTPALLLAPAQPNGGAVCWVHGTRDDKAQYKWPIARALARRGFVVLTFDLPGHGDHPRAFSLPSALTAVPAALSFLAARPEVDPARIGLLGVSLGGALAIRAAVDPGPDAPPVRALCLMETPCSLRLGAGLYCRELVGALSLQALQILRDCSVANLVRRALSQPLPAFAQSIEWIFDELAPAHHVRRLPGIPLHLIYGGRDGVAPQADGKRLLALAPGPKTWHCERAGSHITLIFLETCAQRVAGWFEEVLGGSGQS